MDLSSLKTPLGALWSLNKDTRYTSSVNALVDSIKKQVFSQVKEAKG